MSSQIKNSVDVNNEENQRKVTIVDTLTPWPDL